MATLTANNTAYHVEVQGSGVPLVLLHGFTGSGRNWRHIIPALAEEHTVITIDLPGHGRTDDPVQYDMAQVAADLAVLFDALTAARLHLLGYSMGGRVALYTALHYPDRIASLTLESASPGLRTEAERAERRQRDDALAAFIEREGITAFVDFWENVPIFATQQRLPESTRAALRAQRLTNTPTGLANSLRCIGTGVQPSLWDDLGRLELPVTLITGAADSKFDGIARAMGAALPDARHIVIPGAGHTTHLEQPGVFTAQVGDALMRLRPRHLLT